MGLEKVIAFGSTMWSKEGSLLSAISRECMAVGKFQPYLGGRPFTLITDSAARIWLLKSQALSPRYHDWALRLIKHGINLKWRPETQKQLLDALSRLPNERNVSEDFHDSFLGTESLPNVYKGAQ